MTNIAAGMTTAPMDQNQFAIDCFTSSWRLVVVVIVGEYISVVVESSVVELSDTSSSSVETCWRSQIKKLSKSPSYLRVLIELTNCLVDDVGSTKKKGQMSQFMALANAIKCVFCL